MNAPTQSKVRLVIVGSDFRKVLAHGIAMRSTFDAAMVESFQPLRDAIEVLRQQPDCIITHIAGDQSVVDVRDLVSAANSVRVLFLADALPLRSAIARIITGAGHAVLPESEHTAVVEATLVALLAQRATDHA